MARALVSAIAEELGSIITSELRLTVSVKEEVQKLESKFRTIQAVLNDAEKRQLKDEAVKLWLDKLKDVSYEMDDVLDEWNTAMIKADIEKQGKEEEEEEKAETSTAKKRKHRDIAHKIKELNEKFDEINKERETYGFELTRGIEEVERPKTTSFVDVSEILGRDKVRNDLVSILLGKGSVEERSPHVISLVGMGGIGKTTLAQLAYNDHDVKSHFQKRMWVCVSEPFDQCRIAKEILKSIEGQSPDMTSLQSLIGRISDQIMGKKFFLVLDDVWNENPTLWEPFRLALRYGTQGSRIVVTTRKNIVAEIIGSVDMINLEVLSNEDCWLMFSKLAFFDKNPEEHKQLKDLGRKIAMKCKGLPLATKTLGSLMRFKRSREQWKNVLASNLWELEDMGRSLFAPLLLSYYDLSSPLKRCLSYCVVFPKDYVFFIDELLFMWMAHGYIESKANMEIEIMAREYFENLAIRSFFQDFVKDANGKMIGCKMHDIVHDFVQLMTKNECFTINSDKDLGIDYKNARHLHLEILEEVQFPVSIYNAKKLRTLILFNPIDYDLFKIFQHLRCLRALTLNCGKSKELPDEVENFIHLRYLNLLSYDADRLPEALCNLCNLQILKITFGGDRCKKLPQGMGKLINLRHLILDKPYYMKPLKCPRGIGRLTSLRKLLYFIVSGKNDIEGCKLRELKNLNHLQGTLIVKGLGNVANVREAENAQLKKKIHLHHLRLYFDGECEVNRRMKNDVLVLNALESPPNLEWLEITNYQGTTMSSNWTMSFNKLKTLSLTSCTKLECLPPLGKLPLLTSLTIKFFSGLKKVGVEFLGIESKNKKDDILFPNLKTLLFVNLGEWVEWIGIGEMKAAEEHQHGTIMPCLQVLRISDCPKLKSLPDFLCTTPLKDLEIDRSPILSQSCQRGIGEGWLKISHIPNIRIDCECV
ncbi:hypothetical protein RGQ29_013634 [Quercus rubra]|uniref:Uncharacterized protein n=1 Tax=Quercus rubra TaxID=3512 RepID=A0AAN7FK17_QUERU|nr:hypothetical protein RGQ29_013634 [Quercus rubra]